MKLVSIAVGLGLASVPLGVNAREVQLLSFTAPAPQHIDDRARATMDDITGAGEGGLEGALAGDFTAMGGSPAFPPPTIVPSAPSIPAAFIPATAASIPIPRWMQTGMAPEGAGFSPTMAALPALAATCADAPYRPRYDLPSSTEARRARLFPLIAQIACEAGVPAGLFDALVGQESRYNLNALSPKGAIGLTQLMPGTARYLRVANPWDPVENLRGGARYLREQMTEFGRVDLALAAYNAGPGRVRAKRRIPPFRETVDYVSRITHAWSGTIPRVATLISMQQPQAAPAVASLARNPFRGVQLVSYTEPRTANPM